MEEENGKAIWPSLWPVHLFGPPARSRPSSLPRPPWSSSIRLVPSSTGPRTQQLADPTRATSPAARPSCAEARSRAHDQAAQQAAAQPGQQPHALANPRREQPLPAAAAAPRRQNRTTRTPAPSTVPHLLRSLICTVCPSSGTNAEDGWSPRKP